MAARQPHAESDMSDPASYTPPAIWQWQQSNGGRFANINRPVAGATHERVLPVGRHPLQLYSMGRLRQLATPGRVCPPPQRPSRHLDSGYRPRRHHPGTTT